MTTIRSHNILTILFATTLVALLAAANGSFAATQAYANAIEIAEGYVRATPPGQPNTAAFMRLINPGSEPRALVAAHSKVARVVELHTHQQQEGMLSMRRIERIEIPAQGEVVLQPGGLHLMLIDLQQPLDAEVTMELEFDDGQRLVAKLPVRMP